MPPPHYHYQHDQHHETPSPPKPNTKIFSLLLKAMIMTLMTSLFFLLLGLASVLLPLLFTSLHRHHESKADLSNGLSPKGLKKLSLFKFSKKIESRFGPERECVVCLEGFKQGQWCRELVGCGHVFHRKCVDTWLVRVAACPTCRTRVC